MESFCLVRGLLAVVLVFTSTLTAVRPDVHSADHSEKLATLTSESHSESQHETMLRTTGDKVTIFIHGLFVGHYKAGDANDRDFKVGVVKGALGHSFDVNVYTGGSAPQCQRIALPDKGKWVFEVRRDGVAIPRNINMWPTRVSTAEVGRTGSVDASRLQDSNFILDVESDLHKKKLGRRGGVLGSPFDRIVHFYNGDIKTEVLTCPLNIIKLVSGAFETNRSIAEVVGVEISLHSGEQMVMRDKESNVVLWENAFGSGEVEGRIVNLPHDPDYEVKYCKMPYRDAAEDPKGVPCTIIDLKDFLNIILATKSVQAGRNASHKTPPEETHFQYYYHRVFDVKLDDRFELSNPEYPKCYDVQTKAPGGGMVHVRTVPPYRCGMVLAGKKDVE